MIAPSPSPSEEPAGLAAERALLGALMIRGRLDAVPAELQADDFTYAAHRELYRTMLALEADETVVDLVTVLAHLERAGLLERCGGVAYVCSLVDRIPNPDEEGIRAYAKIVRDEAKRRRRRSWTAA